MFRSTARGAAMTALAAAALSASAMTATAAPDPHGYLIVPVHSEKCLDVLGANPGDDADIIQSTCDGRVSQRFSATSAGNDTWLFSSRATGKCFQVAPAGHEGGDVVQRSCDGSPVQRWRVEGEAAHGHRIVSDFTGLCLEVAYASPEDGAEVRQYPCHGQANQRFSFDVAPV
ncbi:RICIN domain-containing protein [Actinokineospora sp. PR83]|uniref:RICIN domain-containing protein n=1 Tax=Actinokineospora sp. PR83 TaxID=2884908 RepID=UPI001F36788D|nr:RICIN domain-containing protein [Actinokineospora sp. PR83]MCG8915178.1 RICIN domain-containing protein [Actinokineospora sp. PR83]